MSEAVPGPHQRAFSNNSSAVAEPKQSRQSASAPAGAPTAGGDRPEPEAVEPIELAELPAWKTPIEYTDDPDGVLGDFCPDEYNQFLERPRRAASNHVDYIGLEGPSAAFDPDLAVYWGGLVGDRRWERLCRTHTECWVLVYEPFWEGGIVKFRGWR